ncbi:MAG: hypothetical protein QOJ54_898 [Aliidongia sp.]|nr:hypothetical protein [Aliidongia sp.]
MSEAYGVVKRWAEAFNEGQAAAIAALYVPDATIWGTLAQNLATSPADVRSYFFDAVRAGLKVKLGPHVLSPISETCAIDAGHYEFTRTVDGQTVIFPARYSFVLVTQGGAWMIVHQHSSIQPKPLAG